MPYGRSKANLKSGDKADGCTDFAAAKVIQADITWAPYTIIGDGS